MKPLVYAPVWKDAADMFNCHHVKPISVTAADVSTLYKAMMLEEGGGVQGNKICFFKFFILR